MAGVKPWVVLQVKASDAAALTGAVARVAELLPTRRVAVAVADSSEVRADLQRCLESAVSSGQSAAATSERVVGALENPGGAFMLGTGETGAAEGAPPPPVTNRLSTMSPSVVPAMPFPQSGGPGSRDGSGTATVRSTVGRASPGSPSGGTAPLSPASSLQLGSALLSDVSSQEGEPLATAAASALPHVARIALRLRSLLRALKLEDDAAANAAVDAGLAALKRAIIGTALLGVAGAATAALLHSFGPLLAASIVTALLQSRVPDGVKVKSVEARMLFTSREPTGARPRSQRDVFLEAFVPPVCDPRRLDTAADGANVVVVQGGVAHTPRAQTCLLAPGHGADMTAALLAVLVRSDRVIKLCSVHGIFTCDPHLSDEARLIRRLRYSEALELAAAGVSVIHPMCLRPLLHANIGLDVRHYSQTLTAAGPSTVITETGEVIEGDDDADAGHSASAAAPEAGFQLLAVGYRAGVTLINIATYDMWGESGFLAKSFAPFADNNISIGHVSTSEGEVSVTCDSIPGGVGGRAFLSVISQLSSKSAVTTRERVAVVTLFGHALLKGLPHISTPLRELYGVPVHLVTAASSGVSISFVVDGGDARQLVQRLHSSIFGERASGDASGAGSDVPQLPPATLRSLGPAGRDLAGATGEEVVDAATAGAAGASRPPTVLTAASEEDAGSVEAAAPAAAATEWWRSPAKRAELLALLPAPPQQASVADATAANAAWAAADSSGSFEGSGPRPQLSMYVYDLATIRERCSQLTSQLTNVAHIFYAIKANSHPEVLRTVAAAGLGLECVSAAEVELVRSQVGAEVPVLFTPNFAAVAEYARAYELGAQVTIDGPDILALAPHIFAGRDVALRIDPGRGQGHSKKVMTAGSAQKFGHPVEDLDELIAAVGEVGARLVGLHAHVGSGVMDGKSWVKTARVLSSLLDRRDPSTGALLLPDIQWIDVGGGLGVPVHQGDAALDLHEVNASLQPFAEALAARPRPVELHMEPGRFVVSESGVLVTTVTQVRTKGAFRFVGVDAGMNALIRPALYKAFHGIYNLTRLDEPADDTSLYQVVGPICETGDVLGRDRELPVTRPGDLLLIANAGAYGFVMSSAYNRRTVGEMVLP